LKKTLSNCPFAFVKKKVFDYQVILFEEIIKTDYFYRDTKIYKFWQFGTNFQCTIYEGKLFEFYLLHKLRYIQTNHLLLPLINLKGYDFEYYSFEIKNFQTVIE